MEIKSILRDVKVEFDKLCKEGKIIDATNLLKQRVLDSKINLKDKAKMLKNINNVKNIYDLQKYFYNALLKYELGHCAEILNETK